MVKNEADCLPEAASERARGDRHDVPRAILPSPSTRTRQLAPQSMIKQLPKRGKKKCLESDVELLPRPRRCLFQWRPWLRRPSPILAPALAGDNSRCRTHDSPSDQPHMRSAAHTRCAIWQLAKGLRGLGRHVPGSAYIGREKLRLASGSTVTKWLPSLPRLPSSRFHMPRGGSRSVRMITTPDPTHTAASMVAIFSDLPI